MLPGARASTSPLESLGQADGGEDEPDKLLLLCCTEARGIRSMARRSLLSPHFTHRETGTKKRRESRDSASLAAVLWPVPTEAQEPFQSGPGPTWRLSSTGPRPPEDLLAPRTPDSNPRDKQPGLGASAPSSIHQTTVCLLSKSSTCHLSFLPPSMVPIHTHWGLEPQLGAWFLSTCAPPHAAWGCGVGLRREGPWAHRHYGPCSQSGPPPFHPLLKGRRLSFHPSLGSCCDTSLSLPGARPAPQGPWNPV